MSTKDGSHQGCKIPFITKLRGKPQEFELRELCTAEFVEANTFLIGITPLIHTLPKTKYENTITRLGGLVMEI